MCNSRVHDFFNGYFLSMYEIMHMHRRVFYGIPAEFCSKFIMHIEYHFKTVTILEQ